MPRFHVTNHGEAHGLPELRLADWRHSGRTARMRRRLRPRVPVPRPRLAFA